MSEAQRLHGHLIGQQGSRRSLNTPALVLDLEMLDRNIAEMAAFAKAHGMKLRPHSKTHKSADIARRQVAAGALGVCCAKLGEAGKYRVRYIEKMSSPFSQFMGGFAGSRIGAAWLKDSDFARALLARSLPEMEAQLRFVEEAVNDRQGAPVKTLAYCFCGF